VLHRSFFAEIITQDGDITMPELASALHDATGVHAHPNAIGKFLRKLGYTHKKATGRCRAPPNQGKSAARRLGQASYPCGVGAT
jgi:transposase